MAPWHIVVPVIYNTSEASSCHEDMAESIEYCEMSLNFSMNLILIILFLNELQRNTPRFSYFDGEIRCRFSALNVDVIYLNAYGTNTELPTRVRTASF